MLLKIINTFLYQRGNKFRLSREYLMHETLKLVQRIVKICHNTTRIRKSNKLMTGDAFFVSIVSSF